jgi:Protein of unknown function (DUF3383)
VALYPLRYTATVDVEKTPSLNKQGLSASSLVRFRQSLVEALLGWKAICNQAVEGIARAIHFWTDLSSISRFAIGTNTNLYLFPQASTPTDPLINITPVSGYTPGSASSGAMTYSLQIWSLDNFGEDLIAVPSGQGIFIWRPEQGNTPAALITTNAVLTGGEVSPNLTPWQAITDGGFSIAIGGTLENYSGLDFSAVAGINDIQSIIQAAVGSPATVGAQVLVDGNWQFTLTSSNASLSYANAPSGGATDISALLGWTSSTAESLSPGGAPPAHNQGMLVLDQIQIILCYGCTPVGSTGDLDPMLTRWCDQSNYQDWTASTTNQAGSYRLPHGSRIVGGLQVPGMALLWTDVGLWAVQYIGFPLVFSDQSIGQNCGLIAQKAAVVLGQIVYWMSDHGFFVLSGGGPQQIPCSVWDIVYKNLDDANRDKCIAGTDYHYSEVWWFYPSANGNTGEIDSYVKVNIESNSWDYGPATPNTNPVLPGTPNQFSRTAWTDQNQPGTPVNIDLGGLLQQMDQGFTANGDPIIGGYVQSGYSTIAEGDQDMSVSQFIPDFMWGSPDSEIELSLLFRSFPSDEPTIIGPFTITSTTEYVSTRTARVITMPDGTEFTGYPNVRAREVAVEISTISGWYRWGNPRLRARPSGKMP